MRALLGHLERWASRVVSLSPPGERRWEYKHKGMLEKKPMSVGLKRPRQQMKTNTAEGYRNTETTLTHNKIN